MKLFALLVVLVACEALTASAVLCGQQCYGWCRPGQGTCLNGVCGGDACSSTIGQTVLDLPEVETVVLQPEAGQQGVFGNVVKGLDGRAFLNPGKAGKFVSIISEKNYQINAQLMDGLEQAPAEAAASAPYVESIGLQLFDMAVSIQSEADGKLTVEVDGRPVKLSLKNNFTQIFTSGEVTVKVEEYGSARGQSVLIRTPLYGLTIYAVPHSFVRETQTMVRGHLDLVMTVDANEHFYSSTHGILGQITRDTASDNALLPPSMQTDFLGEGRASDYEVSSLFANDFKFNRFHARPPSAPGTVSAEMGRQLVDTTKRHRFLLGQ